MGGRIAVIGAVESFWIFEEATRIPLSIVMLDDVVGPIIVIGHHSDQESLYIGGIAFVRKCVIAYFSEYRQENRVGPSAQGFQDDISIDVVRAVPAHCGVFLGLQVLLQQVDDEGFVFVLARLDDDGECTLIVFLIPYLPGTSIVFGRWGHLLNLPVPIEKLSWHRRVEEERVNH